MPSKGVSRSDLLWVRNRAPIRFVPQAGRWLVVEKLDFLRQLVALSLSAERFSPPLLSWRTCTALPYSTVTLLARFRG